MKLHGRLGSARAGQGRRVQQLPRRGSARPVAKTPPSLRDGGVVDECVVGEVRSVDYATRALRRERTVAPTAPRPTSIIAQAAGSGAALKTWKAS